MPCSFVTSQPLISLEPVEVTDRSWNYETIQKRIIYGLIWPSSFSFLTKKDKALDPCIDYPGLISTAVEGAESVRGEKMLAEWACLEHQSILVYNTGYKYLLSLACEW